MSEENKQIKEEEQKKQKKKNGRNKSFKRDERGLVVGLKYFFKENGLIDWIKMIKEENFRPNIFMTSETDIKKLTPKELFIDLNGLRDLAVLRGYKRVAYYVTHSSIDYASVCCDISWIPNYETGGREVTFHGLADAHLGNTRNFGKIYLLATAENRAFARAVRNFLNISTVCTEETKNADIVTYTGEPTTIVPLDPKPKILDILTEKNISFEQMIQKLIESGMEEAKNYKKLDDISSAQMCAVLEILKELKSLPQS